MEQRLQECLKIAMKHNVTDIHLSLLENNQVVIEMRVNGVIRRLRYQKNDRAFFNYLLYRANLDLSCRHKPQTGRFDTVVNNQKISLRFAIMSSLNMTSGVLRILNNNSHLRIDQFSNDQTTNDWLNTITEYQNGLFLFSGPTGSGKTTTLYTLLNEVQGKKIFTLEDPVEVYSSNYVQLSVNENGPITFQNGIKQLLRHDPDIIMIGEIRDEMAAEMAVRCALTGHLVLSSIHSSNCVTAIHRMLELDVNQRQLQTVLNGVTNQRLCNSMSGNKVPIFEIMDKEEVNYYFEHQETSKQFVTIEQKICEAKENKIIIP